MIWALIIWIACGCLCEYIGNQKAQKGCFWYGFLLGVIGLIIVLCLKDKSGEVSANTSTNKYDDLERLQKLKESGAITEIEFEVEKSKLLK